MNGNSSNLWHNTTGYGATAPTIHYLTAEQNLRHERIRVARMLWKGQHRQCFLEERRTQAEFPDMKSLGRIIRPYITFNVMRLVTTTVTDLMLGAEPAFKSEAKGEMDAIKALVNRSDLHRVFYSAAQEASWSAEGTVEIVRYAGEVYITNTAPGSVYPLGPRNPDGQYDAYRRFETATVGKKTYLLETTWSIGAVERKVYELLEGGAKKDEVAISAWPVPGLLPREETGLDVPTIVWCANELDEGEPTSDYDGLIELQDELNAKQTQIFRVISKHADPKLAAPKSLATPGGNVSSDMSMWWFNVGEEIPQYIVWNAELASALEDRNFTVSALCTAAELSPVLLGLKQGATPDSARKLRLEANKSLSRKDRKVAYFMPFMRYAIELAMALEKQASLVKVAMGDFSVELRDGLPKDEVDEATVISTLRACGAMSVERAVEMQIPDAAGQERELQRLEAERKAATPSVVLGETNKNTNSGRLPVPQENGNGQEN